MGPPPTDYLVARFIRVYGIATYRDARWPTRDGVIPMRLFFTLLERVPNIEAAEQLQTYYATLLATAHVHASEDARPTLRRAVDEIRALAAPDGA